MAQDYYKALGVDKKASSDEVKKAYRKLARELHPDRNPGDAKAEARFKEISAAYDTLSDPEKRKAYDRQLLNPFVRAPSGGPQRPGFDAGGFGDILSDLFGGKGRGPSGGPAANRGRNLEAEVSVSFAQAVAGAQVPLSVPTAERCGTCRGSGAKPGTSPQVCPRCQGRGIEAQGQGLFSISQPCQRCEGAGTVIDDPCATCSGSGRTRTVKRYRVNIPAGVKDGGKLRLTGKGEPGPNGGPAGDLIVITRVQDSPVFTRKGDHVEVEVPLTIPEALRGGEIEVPTLNGRKTLRVAPGTRPGSLQRLRGEGPPKLGSSPPTRGDIHYRFTLDMPDELSAEQRRAVDDLAVHFDGDPRARLFEGTQT